MRISEVKSKVNSAITFLPCWRNDIKVEEVPLDTKIQANSIPYLSFIFARPSLADQSEDWASGFLEFCKNCPPVSLTLGN